MYRITKRFTFCAAHHLQGYQGKCARVHGHNYVVELELKSAFLNPQGFLRDFTDLKAFGQILEARFDHSDLTEVLDIAPTTENLARELFEIAAGLYPETSCVRVWENENNSAAYSRE